MSYVEPQPPSPIGDILGSFWRHRMKATGLALLVLLATAFFTATSEPTFKSVAQLNVKVGRNSATLDPTVTTGQFVALADPREAEINAVGEMIKSRATLEAVIDQMGVDVVREKDPNGMSPGKMLSFLDPFNLNPLRVYSNRDDAVKRASKQLKVMTARNSNVVSLTYQSKSPELAQQVLKTIVEIVRERHTQVNKTRGSLQFFEEERTRAQAELVSLENKRMELKNATGLADLTTQREKTLGRVRYLQDEIGDTKAKLVAAETELNVRTEMLKNTPASIVLEETTGEVASARDKMREELFRLETKEKEYLSKYTEDSIYVKMVRDQLEKARSVVTDEKEKNKVTRGVSKSYEELQIALNNVRAERDGLKSKLDELTTQLTAANDRLKVINEKEKDFQELDRNIELANNQYREFHRAYQQTMVDQGLEEQKITNINLLQEPTISQTPSSPNPLLNLAMGLGLSLVSCFGLVTMLDRRRPSLGEVLVERPREMIVPAAPTATAASGSSTREDVPDLTPPSSRTTLRS